MKSTLILLFALVSFNALAESPAVYEKSFDQNLDIAYKRVYKAREGSETKENGHGVSSLYDARAEYCPG